MTERALSWRDLRRVAYKKEAHELRDKMRCLEKNDTAWVREKVCADAWNRRQNAEWKLESKNEIMFREQAMNSGW